jgi:nucleoside-diphosphate-sugar epimerase
VSVKEIIETVFRIMGKKDADVVCDKTRVRPGNSEVEALTADCSHLRELTGWEPKHSYEDGIRVTIDWIKQHLQRYKTEVYNI